MNIQSYKTFCTPLTWVFIQHPWFFFWGGDSKLDLNFGWIVYFNSPTLSLETNQQLCRKLHPTNVVHNACLGVESAMTQSQSCLGGELLVRLGTWGVTCEPTGLCNKNCFHPLLSLKKPQKLVVARTLPWDLLGMFLGLNHPQIFRKDTW